MKEQVGFMSHLEVVTLERAAHHGEAAHEICQVLRVARVHHLLCTASAIVPSRFTVWVRVEIPLQVGSEPSGCPEAVRAP